MSKGRLEAFSDGVIAILITIMVLELRAPQGTDLAALAPLGPDFLSYILSFALLGIYWPLAERCRSVPDWPTTSSCAR